MRVCEKRVICGEEDSKMDNPASKLKQYRPQLLLAEAIALLHDIGKLHAGHLFKYTREHTQRAFGHHEILSKIKVTSVPSALLRRKVQFPLHKRARGSTVSLQGAIERHHKPTNDATELLRAVDVLDSGVDRSAVFNAGQQSLCATCITTAFGLDIQCYALAPNDEISTDGYSVPGSVTTVNIRKGYTCVCDQPVDDLEKALCQVLGFLERYLRLIDDKLAVENLYETRREFLDEVREQYSKTLGETRRAANDVTLWDHSYSVATLYKAALAGLLVDPPGQFKSSQIRWRVFRVGFDGLGIIAKGHRIGDMLGYRQALDVARDEVKRLVEVDWALGNEVYHDENGIYFLVPALRTEAVRKELEPMLGDAARRAVLNATGGEVVPVIGFGGDEDEAQGNGSRGLTRLGREIAQTDEDVRIPVPDTVRPDWPTRWGEWEQVRKHLRDERAPHDFTRLAGQCEYCVYRKVCAVWEGKNYPQVDGCPVCNARPKCENQMVCPVCSERREGRAWAWYAAGRESTIWIDEVADRNDRVAVLVGRFDLTHWLDGSFENTYLNTFLVHSLKDWERKVKVSDAGWETVVDHLKDAAAYAAMSSSGGLSKETVSRLATFFQYFDFYHPDKDLTMAFERAAEWVDRTPENLAVLLFRKHPSPARLRRTWETTERFWDEVVEGLLPDEKLYDSFADLETRGGKALHDARFQRLSITVGGVSLHRLAYDARIGPLRLSIYWSGAEEETGEGQFITLDNLQLLMEQTGSESVGDLADWIAAQGQIEVEIPLRGQERALGKDGSRRRFTITGARLLPDRYHPFAHILITPRLFTALVPAVDALDIAQAIRRKYEAEFSKVKNRLPLHLGVVYFHRRTPLYAAMDAARRMLPVGCRPPEVWNLVDNAQSSDDGSEVKLRFDNGIEWALDTATGDPGVPDDYYPYFLVSAGTHPAMVLSVPDPAQDGPGPAQEGQRRPLVHTRDLKKDDSVRVDPSLFDFEFLDTIGRRFEVSYKSGRRRPREGVAGPRPYYLDHLTRFRCLWWLLSGYYSDEFHGAGKGLTSTQLSNIETLIGTRTQEWGRGNWTALEQDEAFRRFARDTLISVGRSEWWDHLGCTDDETAAYQALLVQAACDGMLLDVIELYRKIMKVKPLGKEVE
jgi:hypothetical protein